MFHRILTIGALILAIAAASLLMVGRVLRDFQVASTERTTRQELLAEGVQLVQKAAAAFGVLEEENRNLRAENQRLLSEWQASVIKLRTQTLSARKNAQAWQAHAADLRWFRNAYSDQSERFEARCLLLEQFITENTCLPVPAEPATIPTLAPPEVR